MNYWKNWDIQLRNAAQWGVTLNEAGEEIDLAVAADLLGGEVDGQCILCPSPGRGPKDRSCMVRVSAGSSIYIYHCEGSEGYAYAHVREVLGLPNIPKDHSGQAQRVWGETVACTAGSHVERYLRKRCITLPVPPTLRYHPHCWHSGTRTNWPAMVAARADVNGVRVAIQRTYLSSEAKAPITDVKMDLGPSRGTGIRLSPVCEELMIGEGIETTLSGMELYGLPGWAAGGTGAMRRLILPPEVRSVIILADGEEAGRTAARAAAARWLGEGRRVRIFKAPAGKDFNNVLQERCA